MNWWVQLKLLCTFWCFQSNYDTGNDFVSRRKIIALLCFQLCNLSFPNLFCFLNLKTDWSSEMFHQNFSLFHFRRKDLRSYHGAKWNFRAKLLRNSKCDSCFSCAWGTGEKESSSGHFFRLNEIDSNTSSFSCEDLADHSLRDFWCIAILLETETFDVSMCRNSLSFGGGSNFFNLEIR